MGTKITALPQVVNTVGTDELPISQDDGSGGRITYKATLDQVKNYVKNTGGGTGSVTSVSVSSTDGSISVFGSPIVGAGTITVNVSSVGLDKLDDGGATSGQVLTYNGSTTTWVASAVPKELPQTALSGQVLTYNGSTTTWVASAVPKELPQTALSGQVLTYNGSTSTWVASAAGDVGIGVNQTWQDMTSQRIAGTTYTNTTGRTITVIVGGAVGVSATWTFTVDGILFTYAITGGSFGSGSSHTCPIPAGSTYSASNFAKWLELR